MGKWGATLMPSMVMVEVNEEDDYVMMVQITLQRVLDPLASTRKKCRGRWR